MTSVDVPAVGEVQAAARAWLVAIAGLPAEEGSRRDRVARRQLGVHRATLHRRGVTG